jgi:hypothetical protein
MNGVINLTKIIDKYLLFNLLKKIYISYLRRKNKNFLKKFKNKEIILSNKKNNHLNDLCNIYGTDKNYPHSYTNYYHKEFDQIRDQVSLIFEMGIGSNDISIPHNIGKNGKSGASLYVWSQYFKNSIVFGGDIDKKTFINLDRIKSYYVDQNDQNSIRDMWDNINEINFDIIIDDGHHALEPGVTFFKNSFYKLKKNGLYIIEDVHIAYLDKLVEKLKEHNPKIILFENNNNLDDNNLVVFKKID